MIGNMASPQQINLTRFSARLFFDKPVNGIK